MPSSAGYKRNYKQEQATARARGDTKARAKRNAARAKLKASGVAVDGKDVDHKAGVKAGNSKNNLRTLSPASNRSKGGKKGSAAGKSKGGKKGMNKRWGKKNGD
jgi:hypothetical protein